MSGELVRTRLPAAQVAKNPFYVPEYPAEAAAGDERLPETLQRMELVVCGLVSYHPVDEIANNYFLRALR